MSQADALVKLGLITEVATALKKNCIMWNPMKVQALLADWGARCRLSEEKPIAPNRWRTLAAEARERASRLSHPDAVRTLLHIAETYDNLAERMEKSSERKQIT
jgi:hypothetical protein